MYLFFVLRIAILIRIFLKLNFLDLYVLNNMALYTQKLRKVTVLNVVNRKLTVIIMLRQQNLDMLDYLC